MNKKKYLIAGTTLVAIILPGLPYTIDDTHYEISDARIRSSLKIGVIADLHCRSFGYKQSRIMKIINREKPDLIILPGDLFDKGRNYQHVFDLIDALKEYSVYFTTGNHDRRLKKDIASLCDELQKKGVHVLEDTSEVYIHEDTILEIAGMSDHGRVPIYSPEAFSAVYETNHYRILISHRPDYREFYKKIDCDLIISGHNHGGQWRIPFTKQGIYTPGDGLFPKYAGGLYDLNGRKMIVSRGLATGSPLIPRLYNNPEIVFIDLRGE